MISTEPCRTQNIRVNTASMREPEHVVLVDRLNQAIGKKEKLAAHQTGELHRAFSVQLYRDKQDSREYLLQQRAFSKYHSGGLWTNTCCSHPRPGETLQVAATRRLYEEMGIAERLDFRDSGIFLYKARLNNQLTEHELDHVLTVKTDAITICPNPDEVASWRWWTEKELIQAINNRPYDFTVWFPAVLKRTIGQDH
ncbi:Isopentenyl-diphosphate Delta-isomerase [invertebrate metagenome]|uniref:isopentenyl-diphosphate Delta-isomerase n=1 Tax=invertebrate metagenome TaxID=1711999 RepID=A0A2H9T4C3_9ZZZZ